MTVRFNRRTFILPRRSLPCLMWLSVYFQVINVFTNCDNVRGVKRAKGGGSASTDRVQLLLQGLDLGLHRPHELLHLLVAADGAAGRSWRGKHKAGWGRNSQTLRFTRTGAPPLLTCFLLFLVLVLVFLALLLLLLQWDKPRTFFAWNYVEWKKKKGRSAV